MEEELSADELADIEAGAGEVPLSEDELADINAAASAPQSDTPAPAPQQPARPPPDPGFLRSVGSSLMSGFYKQGSDEAAAKLGSAFTDVLPGARYKLPDGTERPVADKADLYRAARDNERQVLAGASEHRPVTSFVANLAGDLGSDFVLSQLGIPVTSPAYQALSGAASGLMGSDAELSSGKATPGSGASAAASTALGGTLGWYAPKVGERVARALPGLMSRAREGLENLAVTQGRRVLLNGADSLAGNRPVAPEAVREALESGAIRPLGTTQGAYARLEELAEQRGGAYAAILERLQAAGVQGPQVETIARELLEMADDAARNSGADKSVANLYRAEADNVRNVAPGGFSMPESGLQGAPASSLVLEQAERIKRDLQDKARWERLRMTGTDEAKQKVSQVYRGAIEDAIAEAGEQAPVGSEVAQLAEEFLPVKQQLSRTIGARDAAERGTAAAAKRRGISLTDYLSGLAAASTGGPAGALLGAAGNNLLRNRGTSTAASAAYGASRAAGELGRWAATEPATARTLGQVGAGLMSRQVVQADWLQNMLGANPDAMGKYGPMLANAQAQGPEALAQAHYVLSQTDPEYAAQVQRAAQAGQQ